MTLTVKEVLQNFRDALVALTPAMDKVAIPWRRPDAYDDWDSLAAQLYEVLVVAVLQYGTAGEAKLPFVFRRYDLVAETSALESHILVLENGNYLGVFNSFQSSDVPFQLVEYQTEEGGLHTVSFQAAEFLLRVAGDDFDQASLRIDS